MSIRARVGKRTRQEVEEAPSSRAQARSSSEQTSATMHSRAHQQQLQAEIAEHQAAIADLKAELKQSSHDLDSRMFRYVLRGHVGPQDTGCLPKQILQAEPDSALAKMFSDDWSVIADEQGRAIINSKPEHFAMIVDWLSFATVPKHPTHEFISEIKYWQLNRLLAAIETERQVAHEQAQEEARITKAKADAEEQQIRAEQQQQLLRVQPGHDLEVQHAVDQEGAGFRARGNIFDFAERMHSALESATSLPVDFKAYGRRFRLDILRTEVHICMLSGFPLKLSDVSLQIGENPRLSYWAAAYNTLEVGGSPFTVDFRTPENPDDMGVDLGQEAARITHPCCGNVQGSVNLDVKLLFWEL